MFSMVSSNTQVFTHSDTVRALLDLCQYNSEQADLTSLRVLEPCCGDGAFLVEIVDRLLRQSQKWNYHWQDLEPCVRAFEINPTLLHKAAARVRERLLQAKLPPSVCHRLITSWLRCDDFLQTHPARNFDVVVGNPPYLRYEAIPDYLRPLYRARFATFRGRSDLYVPFFEQGLHSLKPNGVLGFLCSEKWTRSHYGHELRKLIATEYQLLCHFPVPATKAFQSAATTNPALTLVKYPTQLPKCAPVFDDFAVSANPIVARVFKNYEEHPTLTDAGIEVGIGVTTGCDSVYVRPNTQAPVEPNRQLLLATTRDCKDVDIVAGNSVLINPWNGSELVDLAQYPQLSRYLHGYEPKLRSRVVAKKQQNRWYRTIDRVKPGLQATPKLLTPGIQKTFHVCLDPGLAYPHHNLLYLISERWDLKVLQALLHSTQIKQMLAALAPRIDHGYYNIRVEDLRMLRVPYFHTLSTELQEALIDLRHGRDQEALDNLAATAYGG